MVVARGPGVSERDAPIGQRVMDHHYAGCGVCKHCRVGWAQLCRAASPSTASPPTAGTPIHEGAGPTLVPLPDELSFAEGAAISCGTGTAYGALRRMDLAGGDTLAVFGQGPVGLCATLLGAAMGARVIAVETSADAGLGRSNSAPTRRSRARLVRALKALTEGEGVDLALDSTGAAAARLAAVRSAKTWGTGFVGEGSDVTFDVSPDLLRRQLTLIGSWTFSAMGQAECARFIVDNEIDLDALFSHRWKLEQADGPTALRHADHRQGRYCFHMRTLFLLLSLGLSFAAAAQSDRPLRIILPFAPGSGVDTITRAVGPSLSKALGQAVVMENLPGAGSITGTAALVKAPADGSHIAMISNNHVINPSVYAKMRSTRSTTSRRSWCLGTTPLVVVVNPSKVPATTLQEFIAFLKAKPGVYNYASSGNGTILHLAAEMLVGQASSRSSTSRTRASARW